MENRQPTDSPAAGKIDSLVLEWPVPQRPQQEPRRKPTQIMIGNPGGSEVFLAHLESLASRGQQRAFQVLLLHVLAFAGFRILPPPAGRDAGNRRGRLSQGLTPWHLCNKLLNPTIHVWKRVCRNSTHFTGFLRQ